MSDVDLPDALATLGVELPTTAEHAHRAYIRCVKRTSPEADPEGFQRLRAAYELVREHLARGPTAAHTAPAGPIARSELAELVAAAEGIEGPDEWRHVERAFERAANGNPERLAMPVLVATETLTTLMATGDRDGARALLETVQAWIDTVGTAAALPGEAALRYPLIRDLVQVGGVLDEQTSLALSRHVARDRVAAAGRLLRALTRRDARLATRAAALLEGSSSLFAGTFAKHLVIETDPPDASWVAPTDRELFAHGLFANLKRVGVIVFFVVLFFVLVMLV